MNRIRMNESDLEAEEPRTRVLVDQVGARTDELGQRRAEIAHLVGDVVHPRAALRQKATNRRVFFQRFEELHPSRADTERRSPHALVIHGGGVLDLRAEETLVRDERRIEVLDRDTQMVDPPCGHAGDSIGRGAASGLGS